MPLYDAMLRWRSAWSAPLWDPTQCLLRRTTARHVIAVLVVVAAGKHARRPRIFAPSSKIDLFIQAFRGTPARCRRCRVAEGRPWVRHPCVIFYAFLACVKGGTPAVIGQRIPARKLDPNRTLTSDIRPWNQSRRGSGASPSPLLLSILVVWLFPRAITIRPDEWDFRLHLRSPAPCAVLRPWLLIKAIRRLRSKGL